MFLRPIHDESKHSSALVCASKIYRIHTGGYMHILIQINSHQIRSVLRVCVVLQLRAKELTVGTKRSRISLLRVYAPEEGKQKRTTEFYSRRHFRKFCSAESWPARRFECLQTCWSIFVEGIDANSAGSGYLDGFYNLRSCHECTWLEMVDFYEKQRKQC
jgi:hypothetical protein